MEKQFKEIRILLYIISVAIGIQIGISFKGLQMQNDKIDRIDNNVNLLRKGITLVPNN
jgi:hypothetical protein|tara:strand:- start:93 stop:266 length:174 start_codon:yes stop_codon:yes gene_type:complete